MPQALVSKLAEELADAERERRGIPIFSIRVPELDWELARAVARARDAMRIAAGDVRSGYKLGFTSEAMRAALGIRKPNFGSLWASMRVESTKARGDYIHPKAEPEVAYLARTDLRGAATAQDVRDAAAGWTVAIEIIDTRFDAYKFTWEDNTADNSSGGGFVLGDWSVRDDDPEQWRVDMSNAGEVRVGRASAAMGSPAESVAWLVRSLDAEGGFLRAGDIVLTGGLTPPVDLESGSSVEVRSPQLGPCSLRMT